MFECFNGNGKWVAIKNGRRERESSNLEHSTGFQSSTAKVGLYKNKNGRYDLRSYKFQAASTVKSWHAVESASIRRVACLKLHTFCHAFHIVIKQGSGAWCASANQFRVLHPTIQLRRQFFG